MAQPPLRFDTRGTFQRVGRLTRTVAALLIAGVWRKHDFEATEARIARMNRGEQVRVVGATLGLLALGAYGAAQFGLVGILLYWLAVIVIAR